ncbi:MAG: MFS transporter [Erysipelotrichaceae bacterium]|nr:MFS transporter [Erysipelotrichaceae bacterium]
MKNKVSDTKFKLKSVSVAKLNLLVFLYSLVANFAHPITPTFIKMLGLHDYMFGLAFACMAFTNFLFSPFWGKMASRYGAGKVFSLAFLGYGTMQFFFGFSTEEWQICLARLGGGFFISALSVCQMVYVIKNSEHSGRDLAILATIGSVVSPFGFLIGGFLGDWSIKGTFIIQGIGLFVISLIGNIILDDSDTEDAKFTLSEINPFTDFIRSKDLINGFVVVFLIMVTVSSFGSTCYDQCFNYYIKDQFNFPSSYNGILKAGVGFIALFANSFITIRLLKTDTYRTISYVFAMLTLMLVGVVVVNDMIPFIIINIVFFGCNSIYLPLLQDFMTKKNADRSNEMVGLYNATRAIGMVVGSLFAGFIYGVHPKLSFVFAAVAFGLCVLLSLRHAKMAKA